MSYAEKKRVRELKKRIGYEWAMPPMCSNCKHFSPSGKDGGQRPFHRSRCMLMRTWVDWHGVCNVWVDRDTEEVAIAETVAEATRKRLAVTLAETVVPRVGIEPTLLAERDFESLVDSSSFHR